MANPHKGEVSFDADGATYTLRYSTNAICELEDILKRGIIDIAREMSSWGPPSDPKGDPLPESDDQVNARVSRIRMSFLRAVFWAGLRDHHPDIDVRAAGELMVAAGGMDGTLQHVSEAFARAFPTPETKGARPPMGGRDNSQGGTGPVS